MDEILIKEYERRMNIIDELIDENDLDAVFFISTSAQTKQVPHLPF